MSFLSGENLVGGYGGADILKGCSIDVNEGEIAVIVGPNGAGKSTAMKALLGMLDLKQGEVRFRGKDISNLTPQHRIAEGIAFVPQTSNVFTSMTVYENLEMGAFLREDNINPTLEQVYELFPILADKRDQLAGELSGGQRQQVAVGRALMSQPAVLMLDEPTAVLDAAAAAAVEIIIGEQCRRGAAVVLVSHDQEQAGRLADTSVDNL